MAIDNDEDFTFGEFISTQSSQFHSIHKNSDSYSNRVDSGPAIFGTQKGALPLSFFGEVEDEIDVGKGKSFDFDHNVSVNLDNNANFGKFDGGFDPNLGVHDGNFVGNNQKIMYGNGSGLDSDNFEGIDDDDDDDYGEWEFRGALSGNMQDQGGSSTLAGARVEKSVAMPLENQAGQGASKSVEHKPDFSSFSLQTNDLFVGFPRAVHMSSEKDDGFKSTSVLTNGFVWDSFHGGKDISHQSGVVNANKSIKHESGLSSSLPQSNDLFANSLGAYDRSSEIDVGEKSTSATTNGFAWDTFHGVEKIGNESETSGTNVISLEHKPRSSSFFPLDDLFAATLKSADKTSEMDIKFKPTNATFNSYRFGAFPEVEKNGKTSAVNGTNPGSVEQKPDSSSIVFPSFMAPDGAANKSNEMFGGFKKTSVTTNGFTFDPFPGVASDGIGNGINSAAAIINEDDDLDDFGDFIDACQEVRMDKQEEIFLHMTVTAEAQLENGKSQVQQTLPVNSKEALPLSLFGDITKENSETLNHSDEFVNKHTSNPGNSFSDPGSVGSIRDLVSNLYRQAHTIQSVTSDGKPTENGTHHTQEMESPTLVGDDEWDDDSWEFKGASRESGVSAKPSSDTPGNSAQIQLEMSKNFKNYVDFYTELRDSLCFLLLCQVDQLQKASDTGTGVAEITETLDNEIEEIRKLLEQNGVSQVVSEKHLEKDSCLNEVCKILDGPSFKMIESEYSLSKKLQVAVKDWKVAADLLRHAMSILKCLSIGSPDELFHYASTWSNVIDVCAQELRYGAMIWKRILDNKLQRQVLSDCRGQKHIQALGEIYKVVELLGLSTKVYKPWLLCSVSDSSRLMDLLNECCALWSSSGLEEALQNLSDDIDFGCEEAAKALLASIKNIRDIDVLAMHDCVFGQPKSICQLSLLPQEMLPDLKTVFWNKENYFLGLANLWANLISSDPPQLPHVQVH